LIVGVRVVVGGGFLFCLLACLLAGGKECIIAVKRVNAGRFRAVAVLARVSRSSEKWKTSRLTR
jgi:hypothetical protein